MQLQPFPEELWDLVCLWHLPGLRFTQGKGTVLVPNLLWGLHGCQWLCPAAGAVPRLGEAALVFQEPGCTVLQT